MFSTKRRRMALMLLFALAGVPVAPARSVAESSDRVRFGILPLGGAVDSRSDWEPLLSDFGRAIGRSISLLSVGSYEALDRAIRADEVDMAFLSGKMALDAVVRRSMRVVAQVRRHDGLDGYRATLLTRRSGDFTSLQQLLAQPERWRLARGEPRSLSGFVVPQLQLFLPHRIAMETRFQSEIVGTHQRTALAVANNEADVATNNTADFERFKLQFPAEAARLQVIWESDLVPHGAIVIRRDYPTGFQRAVQQFLLDYGQQPGPLGDAQRRVLKSLHDFAGFSLADDRILLPVAHLNHQLALQQAEQAQWINAAAKAARLRRVEAEYAEQIRMLRAD